MKQKLKNWFSKQFIYKEPIDWKWIAIIGLLLYEFKKDLLFLMFVLVGMAGYPAKIDYKPIFDEAGVRIGEMYSDAITSLYEIGISWGEALYPYNGTIALIISYLLWAVSIAVIIFVASWFINIILYKPKKPKNKQIRRTK